MQRRIDKYQKIQFLGKGAFGAVYLYFDTVTRRHVALKHIKLKTDEERELTYREIECQRSIQHPNVVQLIEVIDHDSDLYLVMEYCGGSTLHAFLDKNKQVRPSVALRWMTQLVGAVSCMHTQNILHRDLKPENLLLTSDSETADIKIADFGVSRVFINVSSPSYKGTRLYMAPEAKTVGMPQTLRMDVWALGLILLEMLTGQRPDDESHDQRALRPYTGVHPFLERLLDRMLVYNPNDRADAAELVQLAETVPEAGELDAPQHMPSPPLSQESPIPFVESIIVEVGPSWELITLLMKVASTQHDDLAATYCVLLSVANLLKEKLTLEREPAVRDQTKSWLLQILRQLKEIRPSLGTQYNVTQETKTSEAISRYITWLKEQPTTELSEPLQKEISRLIEFQETLTAPCLP